MPSTAEILSRMMRALPKQPLSTDAFREYVTDLAEVPVPLLEAAATRLIRGSRDPWFPTIGQIREACAEEALGLPSEHEALAQVDARMAWARGGCIGAPPSVDALVKTALNHVGGYPALRDSDNPGAARGHLVRVYRDMRAARIRDASLHPKLSLAP